QIRRSRVEVERTDEEGLVVDHHALRVQAEDRIVFGETRILPGQLVAHRRIRIEFVYLDAGIEQIATLRRVTGKSRNVVCRCERVGRYPNPDALRDELCKQLDATLRQYQVRRLHQDGLFRRPDGLDQLIRRV